MIILDERKPNVHVILRQDKRYGPDTASDFPSKLICIGTKKQAEHLAETLSNEFCGCDHIFYIDDDE